MSSGVPHVDLTLSVGAASSRGRGGTLLTGRAPPILLRESSTPISVAPRSVVVPVVECTRQFSTQPASSAAFASVRSPCAREVAVYREFVAPERLSPRQITPYGGGEYLECILSG